MATSAAGGRYQVRATTLSGMQSYGGFWTHLENAIQESEKLRNGNLYSEIAVLDRVTRTTVLTTR